ncbi:MAG: hypothetical protein GTN81_02410 [Proteobacteria bacterium]|nr:hypothetical protein [Pseudomonadota bacterium]
MPYIVCDKRRGSPKLNVEVCRRKCQFTEECKSYGRYLEANALEEPSLDAESPGASMSHHEAASEEVQAA